MISGIQSFFKPLNPDVYSTKDRWESTQIGRLIDSHVSDHFPDLSSSNIAIFNVSEYDGSKNESDNLDCKIRAALYDCHVDNFPSVADLGSLLMMSTRKESFKNIQDVCFFLISHKIIPIIIGGGNDVSYAVYKAYAALEKYITISSVDNRFDIGLENDKLAAFSYLGKIISHKPNYLFHYVNIAYQSYFVSPLAVKLIEGMNFESIRLGNLRVNFKDIEPIMRNTDFLSFDISAISNSYAKANVYSVPNGLNGEEACKVLRYAGVSDKITSIGLFEYNQSMDRDSQTAYLLSQMIWYFIEGYKSRKNELNPDLKTCIKYTVSLEDGQNQIVFYKSRITGRWWMGVPFKSKEHKKPNHYFVACSYSDYEEANRGEIPKRWIRTSRKLS